jgi:hypothetical protein
MAAVLNLTAPLVERPSGHPNRDGAMRLEIFSAAVQHSGISKKQKKICPPAVQTGSVGDR